MKKIALLFLLFFLIDPAFSQGGPGTPDDDPDMPIDGGMLALMAAGMAYGIKTLRKNRG